MPSVKHSGRYRRVDGGLIRSAPVARNESDLPIGQLRWSPIAIPKNAQTFIFGMCTITTAGDVDARAGMASHVALATQSMKDEYFV